MKKTTAILVLLLLITTLFSGCGLFQEDYAPLVKGNMDAIYLNQQSKEYLDILDDGSTAESLQEQYQDSLLLEAEYFMEYCNIIDAPEETVQRVVDLYDVIYSHSKYEVGESTKTGDSYLVSVTIHPIDIIQNFMEDVEPFADDFAARAENGDFEEYTDAEFEEVWADGLISLVESRLDSIGYLDAETISVQITETDEYYSISENDWSRIDTLIIAY